MKIIVIKSDIQPERFVFPHYFFFRFIPFCCKQTQPNKQKQTQEKKTVEGKRAVAQSIKTVNSGKSVMCERIVLSVICVVLLIAIYFLFFFNGASRTFEKQMRDQF